MIPHGLARAVVAAVLLGGGFVAYGAARPASPQPREEPAPALPDAFDAGAHPLLTVPGSTAESAFGMVGDVAMANGGRSLVLDVLNREVSTFSASGERAALLGSAGPGPGEFMGPVALAVDEVGGGFYVLDERRQGIDLFDSERSQWQRTIPLDFQAADLCFVSGRLYVLGGRNGFILHEVSPEDGRVLRSFAPDADSRNVLLRGYRAGGYLGCAPSGEIAFLPSLRPEVLRFSSERGELLGTTPIPGYSAVRVRPVTGGGMRFDLPDGSDSHDFGASILPLPGGDWLVQVGRLRPRTNNVHEFVSVRSHRLSARDGQIRPLNVGLPRVMAADENIFYAVDTSPYPAVRIVSTPLSEVIQ